MTEKIFVQSLMVGILKYVNAHTQLNKDEDKVDNECIIIWISRKNSTEIMDEKIEENRGKKGYHYKGNGWFKIS